ncbi:MAG: asparagine synthase (glutamine-hydrolyzing) [Solirubrobacteraceae bacterium]
MCGIAGQVRADGAPVDPALIERMCAALEHRGPDSRGSHREDTVGLGVQRLRVIDLETGDQPIYNEDRSVVVVLNGEIYNFRELRARLERAGHVFATHSDTEVIVHLYEDEGPGCVGSLDGMFAFALWDADRRRLLLARDRVGKKPLFYALRPGAITLASELGALTRDPEMDRTIDPRALDCYLAYGYIPAPLSIYAGARKLPPASILVYAGGEAEISRYWRLDYSRQRGVGERRELAGETLAAIDRAVRRRLIADVPVGALLSGGIDSSAVVAAMAGASSRPVKTFSIGYASDEYDELPYARTVAELFATEHHEFTIEPDAIEVAPKIVRHYGEPFADSSAIPSFYVSELTRAHVTVALNGDGGDESFGGYSRYAGNMLADRLAGLPGPVRSAVAAAGDRLPDSGRMNSTISRGRRLAAALLLSPAERYARYMSCFDPDQRAALYADDLKAAIGESEAAGVIAGPWARASGATPLDVMLEVDVESYLPGDLLVKMDIATMAHSLEARSPLLDVEVMELAASIPAGLKVRGLEKKVLLRDALRGRLPDEILDRPKRGFAVPLADWLRTDLRHWAAEILFDPRTAARGYFDQGYVRRMFERHVAAAEDASPRLWALVMLELWHREFVD